MSGVKEYIEGEWVIPGFMDIPPVCEHCAKVIGEPWIHQLGTPLIVPAGYAWVMATGLMSIGLVTYFQIKLQCARRDYQVPAPLIHSVDSMEWNCIARPMSATMEIYPQFLFLLCLGGMELPYWSTVAGWIWISGRLLYARHYYLLDPPIFSRRSGSCWVLGNCMLWIASIKFIVNKVLF